MNQYPIYVGGIFVETNKKIEIVNSYTREHLATTFLASKDELDNAIIAAINAKEEMKLLPSYKRYDILMKIAQALTIDKQRLAEVLALEACKPIRYALAEVDRAIQTFIIAAEESKRLPSEYISIDWTPAGKDKEGIVRYFPIGLIAGIAPFNFPMNLAVHKIAPAIASGNCIIMKPSRSTPLSTLELAKIIDKTELPKGAFSVLPMDRQAGQQLVTDERINMLSFTGSADVGWKMKSEAGKKKVVLELGGNAGVIVAPTADMELAIQKCISGAFSYSGQVCIHTQRIYVHDSIFVPFMEKFCNATSRLKIGDVLNSETDISAMIDEENAMRVETWIDEAVHQGARIVCGGKRHDAVVEPTVLTHTQNTMKVCSKEIFGPIVCIEPYHNYTEAVNTINDSDFGLQAGVFTDSLKEMNYAFDNIDTGGVLINEVPTFRVDHTPYGGIKNSGFGREGVKYAVRDMIESKILVKPIR